MQQKKSKVLENFILIWSKKVDTMQLIWLVKKYFLNKMKQGKGILLNRKKNVYLIGSIYMMVPSGHS